MEEIVEKENDFNELSGLTKEQIEMAVGCIKRWTSELIEIATEIAHQLVELMSETMTVYKHEKKGKRYIIKVKAQIPLYRLFARRY